MATAKNRNKKLTVVNVKDAKTGRTIRAFKGPKGPFIVVAFDKTWFGVKVVA